MNAIFAGSFDPFTVGHLDIVERISKQFEIVYVSILYNPGKDSALFSINEREELIRDATARLDNVKVTHFDGLLVEHARKLNAGCIVRGIRTGADVDYERMLESVNKKLSDIETIYLLSKPEHAYISSSLVRQLMELKITIDDLVPNPNHRIFTERK